MKIIFIYFVNILLYDFIHFLFSNLLVIFLFEMYIVHVFLLLIEMTQLTVNEWQLKSVKPNATSHPSTKKNSFISTAHIQIRLSFHLRLKS